MPSKCSTIAGQHWDCVMELHGRQLSPALMSRSASWRRQHLDWDLSSQPGKRWGRAALPHHLISYGFNQALLACFNTPVMVCEIMVNWSWNLLRLENRKTWTVSWDQPQCIDEGPRTWPLSIVGTKTRRRQQHSFSCKAWSTWFSLKEVEGSGVKKEEARERGRTMFPKFLQGLGLYVEVYRSTRKGFQHSKIGQLYILEALLWLQWGKWVE